MDTIISAVTPLRQRMLEDMRMRKLEPRTQEAYVRAVRKLAAFLHRAPDTAAVEDLRNFQLHLVDSGTSLPRDLMQVAKAQAQCALRPCNLRVWPISAVLAGSRLVAMPVANSS